jgi:uncharacterized protein
MKILVVSDEESAYLWDHYRPGRLAGIDMILSAGDLKANYLSFLVTMANRPLLYVHGNHDGTYDRLPPEGCDCIDDKLVTVNGLRILGLGGCVMYNRGPYQYTEQQMQRRIKKLAFKLYRSKGVDIVLTHAPVRGYGDEDNITHRGFEAFLPLLDKYKPKYLVHGHVHQRYAGPSFERIRRYGDTTIINASERFIIDTDEIL